MSDDPLKALWQSAPSPDPEKVVEAVCKQLAIRTLFKRIAFVAAACVTTMTAIAETSGRLHTGGGITIAWIAAFTISMLWWNRTSAIDRLDRPAVIVLADTQRVSRDLLFLSRCLYAGVPIGAVVTFLILQGQPHATPMAVTGIACLSLMCLSGLILARRQRRHLDALKKLATHQDDL